MSKNLALTTLGRPLKEPQCNKTQHIKVKQEEWETETLFWGIVKELIVFSKKKEGLEALF